MFTTLVVAGQTRLAEVALSTATPLLSRLAVARTAEGELVWRPRTAPGTQGHSSYDTLAWYLGMAR